MTLNFVPFHEHCNAEMLSRLPSQTVHSDQPDELEASVFNAKQLDTLPDTQNQNRIFYSDFEYLVMYPTAFKQPRQILY